MQIRGPLSVTGMSESASRAKIFICAAARRSREELPCATRIVENLARRAFRRPVTAEDVTPLMAFYKSGSATGGFDGGVRDALSAILASPHFLYRVEAGDAAGGTRTLSDLELASRLSFFLWSSLPDEELLKLATESRLSKPDVLAAQVSRMLADPRARSLSDDFAFQWLHLSKLDEITPDRAQFPHASGLLDPRALFKEELRLFVDSVLRSDRSVFELLTADYTFLNERLAMLYGIETVKGSHFRRVTLENTARHGLLGKGAILMLTAYPNRTSPVLRGAWILDRLLGTPPADPPLDVPSLPENRRGQPAKTLRARLEQHRANPTCFACHGVMDPLGFALENFNAVGQFRANDPDTLTPIDTAGQLPDGTTITGPDDLRRQLVERPDHQFVQALTENLMTYALGRSLDYRDMPTVRRIVRQAAADDYRFKSIVLGVVSSDAFRKREAERRCPCVDARRRSTRTSNRRWRSLAMFLSKKHLSRRTVLKGAGATIALPLLDAMIPAGTALAQTVAAPSPRLGFVYFPHGALQEEWTPAQTGRDFEFPFILKPLEPLRDYVTVVSGLRNKGGESSSPHGIIEETWLSCVSPRSRNAKTGVGVTVDQIAARHLGKDTPLPSLELCGEPGGMISFRTPQQPLPMESNPRKAFYGMFGQGDTKEERQAILNTTGSLLDYVRESTATLRRTLDVG